MDDDQNLICTGHYAKVLNSLCLPLLEMWKIPGRPSMLVILFTCNLQMQMFSIKLITRQILLVDKKVLKHCVLP